MTRTTERETHATSGRARVIDDGSNNVERDAVTITRRRRVDPEPITVLRWCDYTGNVLTLQRESEDSALDDYWVLFNGGVKVGGAIASAVLRSLAKALIEATEE